ncbi:MAG: 30S ribosomal protein S20 [Clostridiales bacterium]|nr:30S ribosomal protein S20 [Clostridiales bacterium]
MANIKSAKKRVGITAKQNLRNRMLNSAMKTPIRRFNRALEAGDVANVDAAYIKAVSTVDKAASKGVIHKNAANRKKAQLATRKAKAASR